MATDEQAQALIEYTALNEKAALERACDAPHLTWRSQILTIAEPMPLRSVEDIIQALSKIHARCKIGVRPCRLHSDREKSFLTKAVAKWAQAREMVHMMRLLLHTGRVDQSLWPHAL